LAAKDQTLDIETLRSYLQISPYIRFMNATIESVDLEAQELTMKMPMRPEFERGAGSGQFHGGPIAALIDTAGDFAVIAMINKPVPTANFRVDYLRPATGAHLLARAKVRRIGRTLGVVDIDVFDDQKRLCAVGRGCYGTSSD
jgi:uncharacterized protein (TIGR00369 family)